MSIINNNYTAVALRAWRINGWLRVGLKYIWLRAGWNTVTLSL
jgi:hypothetical protein